MGRVARYKKIKSFDPFSRENGGRVELDKVGIWGLGDNGRKPKKRSKTSEKLRAQKRKRKRVDDSNEGFDVPPEDGDNFNLEDLVGSLKKQAPARNEASIVPAAPAPRTSVNTPIRALQPTKATTPVADDDHVKAAKLLKLEQQVLEKSSNNTVGGRIEGESKRAYHRRVKAETRQIIKEQRQGNQNPEKKQRKKDFLTNKKKKKKGANRLYHGRSTGDDTDDADDTRGNGHSDTLVTTEQAVALREKETAVRFGEQAERPPSFRQLPRGATRKAQKSSSGRAMDEKDVAAEQEAMELIRRKAVAQYQAIKVKRRQQRDFHL